MTRKIVLIVSSALFILKFPLRSRLLSWWDSAQFGLALERYSVVEHRPHPPGYPLYILVGKILTYVTHDPAISFIIIGLASSIAATIIIFNIGKEFNRRPSVGVIASVLYAFAPLTFYHELKALTYVLSAFFSSLIAWECIRIIKGDEKCPYKVAIVLGVMGMVRPFESILLLPLFLGAIWRFGSRKFVFSCLIYAFLQILWLVPVSLLSGGFKGYFAEFLSEAGKHQRSIGAITTAPISKLLINFKAIYYYIRQSYPFWGWFLIIPLIRAPFIFERKRKEISFFALWLAPSIIFYTINNVNYAAIPIFVSPCLSILIASALDFIAKHAEKFRVKLINLRIGRESLNYIFALIILLHLTSIFFSMDIRLFGERHRRYDPAGFNYHKLLAGDGYIYMLKDGIERLSSKFGGADSVIILSDLNYRTLMYYLPDYKVLWTRYLSQRRTSASGSSKLAFRHNDEDITLPAYEYNGKKYWYFKINEKQKVAVFTDEMINNLADGSRFSILPGIEASKAYFLDLEGMWGIYFTYGKFGTISKQTAGLLGLNDDF